MMRRSTSIVGATAIAIMTIHAGGCSSEPALVATPPSEIPDASTFETSVLPPAGDASVTQVCTPSAAESCYPASAESRGVGRCHDGVRRCSADGTSWSECAGQVTPVAEDCATPDDDDCDGLANETCACTPGTTRACYTGPAGTLGVGTCKAGTQQCLADGSGFGPCESEQKPLAETCANDVDDDCDGLVNEEGADCTCVPGTFVACYTGPTGTRGRGRCADGAALCLPNGRDTGSCQGDIGPVAERCGDLVDDDCDGVLNEEGAGCVCTPTLWTECFTGPAAKKGVGLCRPGAKQCNDQGDAFGACTGEVVPSFEDCALSRDEDCDGNIATACTLELAWQRALPDVYSYSERSVVLTGANELSVLDPGVALTRYVASTGVVSETKTLSYDFPYGARIDAAGGVRFVVECSSARTFSIGTTDISCPVGTSVFHVARSGTIAWSHTWPATWTSYAVAPNGTLALSAWGNTLDFGDGQQRSRAFVVVSPSGSTMWTADAPMDAKVLAVGNDGRIIAARGEFTQDANAVFWLYGPSGTLGRTVSFARPPYTSAWTQGAIDANGEPWFSYNGTLTHLDSSFADVAKFELGEVISLWPLRSGGIAAVYGTPYNVPPRFLVANSQGKYASFDLRGSVNGVTGDADGLYLTATGNGQIGPVQTAPIANNGYVVAKLKVK